VLGELVTDFLREIDPKTLVYVGQSCEQLVDVCADFIGKLLHLSRFAEPVRFPSLGEDSVELSLCLASCFLASMLAFMFLFLETIASLPGGWDLAHAIRLGIKPFAELGANLEALSGSQFDSPCSCRAIFESAPVAMLQSLFLGCFCRQ